MKKYLLLSLVLFGSISYAIPGKNVFWSLVSPVRSADGQARDILSFWHKKTADGEYDLKNDHFNYGFLGGKQFKELRATFPKDNPDRLAKYILLFDHSRLENTMKIAIALADPHGGPIQTRTQECDYYDYETTWQQQPKSDRFWWTIRYRRPYTYFATVGKWGTELAIIGGCIYALHRLKKWYQNKTNKSKALDDKQLKV